MSSEGELKVLELVVEKISALIWEGMKVASPRLSKA